MQFLVIANVKPDTPEQDIIAQIRPEARAAWKLYESDIVRSIHYKADMSGAILMMEAATIGEIEKALDSLPMIHKGLLSTEIIPLKPYIAYGKLFAK